MVHTLTLLRGYDEKPFFLKDGGNPRERRRASLASSVTKPLCGWLAIDESAFKRRYRFHTVFSDPERGRVFDLVEGRHKGAVFGALAAMSDEVGAAIETVVIDCHWPYRQAIEEAFRTCATSPTSSTFDDRVTNAFAEGITNKIKVMKRRSYGFRDPVRYRHKVLLNCRRRPSRHDEPPFFGKNPENALIQGPARMA
jgi:transposase